MVNSFTLLADLKAGGCSNTAESTLMHGLVSANRQLRFRHRLSEGSTTLRPYLLNCSDSNLTITYLRWQTPTDSSLLSAIRSTITDRLPGPQRVMLNLRLKRDVNVYVSMFDSLALAIHNKFESYWREPKIVLVTSINPKIVGGIQQDDSWCYIGCSNYIGYQMGFANAVASLSYRVALSVSDHTDSAAFLAFDMEVDKLTNIQASEAVQIVGSGVDAKVDTDLPQSLADIVGNTYTFQLKEGATVLELEAALPEVDVPDQMPKLITRSMLQLSHLLPMIHQLDVQLRPKNNLLWMRMSQIKHVWNN
ncbi:hypothetical protein IGI04_025641 [Brassica rapa subsp. trilocularis]|uniref:Uncharacterized protein n=1 Tax=Brassica rapa subsp. trilocularis TaxID=1813537 RepID=A0ABQ7KTM5_BRACM|nr:hypothetical protein IGI04_025641 [Brassica rapa subsp. trilocularis]